MAGQRFASVDSELSREGVTKYSTYPYSKHQGEFKRYLHYLENIFLNIINCFLL